MHRRDYRSNHFDHDEFEQIRISDLHSAVVVAYGTRHALSAGINLASSKLCELRKKRRYNLCT